MFIEKYKGELVEVDASKDKMQNSIMEGSLDVDKVLSYLSQRKYIGNLVTKSK